MSEPLINFFIQEPSGEMRKMQLVPTEQRNAGGTATRPINVGAVPPRGTFQPGPRHGGGAVITRPTRPDSQANGGQPDPGVLAIKKSALLDLIPVGGAAWACMLERPDKPVVVGNDVIDHENAAMHRDALAAHQQNMMRIRVISELAARAIKVLVD